MTERYHDAKVSACLIGNLWFLLMFVCHPYTCPLSCFQTLNPYFLISEKRSAMSQLVVLLLLLVQVETVVGIQQGSPRSLVLPPFEDPYMEKFWKNVEQEINRTADYNYCGNSCYCDKLCTVFDDCCTGADTKSFSRRQIPKDTLTCEIVQGIDSLTISFVNRCPLNYGDAGIRSECETMEKNGLLNVPVSDPVTNILYRNVYCALCHNVTKYVFWLQKIFCGRMFPRTSTPTESLLSFKTKHHCKRWVKYFHPNFTHRVCKPHVSSCRAGWGNDMYKAACESHTNFVTAGGRYYKNKYCAVCNYEETNVMSRSPKPTQPEIFNSVYEYSFSLVMDANIGGHYTEKGNNGRYVKNMVSDFPSRGRECRQTEVYDQSNDLCRALQCRLPLVLDKGRCIQPLFGFNTSSVALVCPLVVLNATEYESFENNSIWVHKLQILLAADQYQLNGSEVSICVPWKPQLDRVQMFKFDKIQGIVSFIGQIISLTALALNFLTYIIFPSLQNLPGKCIMNLVFALFVAHLLFVVGVGQTGDRKVCRAVAMVMHYGFLASFFWMNVLAFELWKTFTRIEVRHNEKDTKKFLFYAFYSWVSPALIVAIGATGDVLYTHSEFVPGYGKGVCWLTNGSGLLLFFALPIGILLLLNLLLYCLVIKGLAITSKSTALVRQNNDENKRLLLIFVKLTTIMGFTWIFGFTAMFADVPVLWYIFVVFNTLQGLFICLAFVCTKKVFKLFRDMCCKKANKSRPTGLAALQTSSQAQPGRLRSVEKLKRPKTKEAN